MTNELCASQGDDNVMYISHLFSCTVKAQKEQSRRCRPKCWFFL